MLQRQGKTEQTPTRAIEVPASATS